MGKRAFEADQEASIGPDDGPVIIFQRNAGAMRLSSDRDMLTKIEDIDIAIYIFYFRKVMEVCKMADLSMREQQILMAVSLLHPNAYGVSIKEKIEERTGQDLSLGSVYSAVERLEDKGLIETREGEATSVRGGRKKVHITLTGAGSVALSDAVNAMDSLRQGLVIGGIKL